MRIDAISIIITEWIAVVCWALRFNKYQDVKNKVFTLYLTMIAIVELANLLFGGLKYRPLDFFVIYFVVPIEFLFLFYYLLWQTNKKNSLVAILFAAVYLIFYVLDRIQLFEAKTLFDSLSYGVGCLFVILSIVLASRNFFKQGEVLNFTKSSMFWVLIGVTIFYLGTFPYHNFRTYLWTNKQYHSLAYILHYVSQSFCAIMYLLFAYAAKWIVK